MNSNKSFQKLDEIRAEVLASRSGDKPCISVCGGTGCHAQGCEEVARTFQEELAKQGLSEAVDLRRTGCHGFCERGPLAVIHPEGIFYQRLQPKDVEEIVTQTVVNKNVVERLLFTVPKLKYGIVREQEIPFYQQQQRIIFANNGLLDPTDIRDYIALDGYNLLQKYCEK